MNNYTDDYMDAFKLDKLDEYLKTLSDESLKVILERTNLREIKNAVKQELVYRKLRIIFKNNEEVAYYTSKYFFEELYSFDFNNIDEITEFYRVGESSSYLVYLQWMPIGLSLGAIYTIYKRLLGENKTKVDIAVLYTTNIEKCLEIYENSDTSFDLDIVKEDEEFKKFIYDCLLYCEQNKSETESFNRMYVDLAFENKELLRRLQ